MHHFGDDTNVELLMRNLYTMKSVINHELKFSVEWLRSNKSSLNKTKTKLIIFRSSWKSLPREPDIR